MTDILVINRYNENIQWINNISNKNWIKKIIIYNKGLKLPYELKNDFKIDINNVKNKGREGESYLTYIIDNYESLGDNVWFLQADPFDHSPDFLNFFKLGIKMKFGTFQNLTCQYKFDFPPNNELLNFYNIDNTRCSIFFFDKMTLDIVGHNYGKIEKMVLDYEKDTGFKVKENLGIYDYLCDLINIEKPNKIMTHTVSACFYVSKSLILRHSRETYMKLRDYLMEDNFKYKMKGYILERFWNYLLTGNSYFNLNECYSNIFNNKIIGIYDDNNKFIIYLNPQYSKTQYKIVQDKNCYLILEGNKILPNLKILCKMNDIEECYNLSQAKLLYKKKIVFKK